MVPRFTFVFLLFALLTVVSAAPAGTGSHGSEHGLLANGNSCNASTQCSSEYCRRGTCDTKKENGHVCYKDAGCTSGYCHRGTCDIKKEAGHVCYKDSGCLSGHCDSKKCRSSGHNSPTSTASATKGSGHNAPSSTASATKGSGHNAPTSTASATKGSGHNSPSSTASPTSAATNTATTAAATTAATEKTTAATDKTTASATDKTTASATTATTASTATPTIITSSGTYNPGQLQYEGKLASPPAGGSNSVFHSYLSEKSGVSKKRDEPVEDPSVKVGAAQVWQVNDEGQLAAPSGRVLTTDGTHIALVHVTPVTTPEEEVSAKRNLAPVKSVYTPYTCTFLPDSTAVDGTRASPFSCSATTSSGKVDMFYICGDGQLQASLDACDDGDASQQVKVTRLLLLQYGQKRGFN